MPQRARRQRARDLAMGSAGAAWLLVVPAAGVFFLLMRSTEADQHFMEIAVAVFGASGVIVALALPAAELAGHSVERVGNYWLERFNKPPSDISALSQQTAIRRIADVKWRLLIARQGSICVLFAFVISCFALFGPKVGTCKGDFRLDYMLLPLACGLLLVGASMFFPLTWFIYRRDALKDAEDAITNLPKGDPKKTEGSNIEVKNDPANPAPPPTKGSGT